MPDNGTGTYTAPAGTKGVSNTTIESAKQNTWVDDVAAALTNRVAKDGQSTMTGALKMGSQKITGMAKGTASTDGARLDQSADGLMTTRGDVVVRGASIAERLALGASGAVLGSDGTDALWLTNVAKTDANNNFTEGQTIAKDSANANLITSRTGTGASGAFLGAHNSKAVVGSNTAVDVDIVYNGVAKVSIGANGIYTSGQAEPAAGVINAAGYERAGTALPFQRSATSSEIASTPGSLLSLAHGFAAVPELVQVRAICKTAEGNYSVGDVVILGNQGSDANSTNQIGFSVIVNSTNVLVRIGTLRFSNMFDRTTGTIFTPTTANWNLIIKAWV